MKTSSRLFKRFLGNKNNKQKKRFLGKAIAHNNNYMVSMGGQRPRLPAIDY